MLGNRIGNYVVIAELGKGGMGEVFLGEHVSIGRKAAIKLLLPEHAGNEQFVLRFLAEARAASRVRHPNVVDILDYDTNPESGRAFIVMEHLVGSTLRECLKRRERFEPPLAALIAHQVTQGLMAIHAQGMVHRDLKPENVFAVRLDEDQRSPAVIKILDFGTAKWFMTEPGAGELRTKTGALIGTPTYMSPEQCRGGREIGPAADLYALGCILFELVAGRPPFIAAGHGDLIVAHISEPPPALGSLAPGVSPELERLVQRLLFKSPSDRPSALEAAAQLNELAAAHPSRLRALELGLAAGEANAVASVSSKTVLSPAHVWSTSGAPSSPLLPLSSASNLASISERQQSLAEPAAPSEPRRLERKPLLRMPILLGAVLLGIATLVLVFASLRSRSASTPRGAFAGDTRVSAASVTPAAAPATAAQAAPAPTPPAPGTGGVAGAASATLVARPAPRLKARQPPAPAWSASAVRTRAAPDDNIWGER